MNHHNGSPSQASPLKMKAMVKKDIEFRFRGEERRDEEETKESSRQEISKRC